MRRSLLVLVSCLIILLSLATPLRAEVRIAVGFAPPPLPVYVQPPCPQEGFIWIPGYWAWNAGDYYWVPGTWVMAPQAGYLWTPPYWGWDGVSFVFYEGYWGPHVGFYGGINYGYGYFGRGYDGGRWQEGHFYYNREVNNVNVNVVHNVYRTTVINNNTNVVRVSYNGGRGGVNARPTPEDESIAHGNRVPPVAAQQQQVQEARGNPRLRAADNHGKPPIAATPRPAAFTDHAAVAARKGGNYTPPPRTEASAPAGSESPRPSPAVHPHDLPPVAHQPVTNPNPKQQQKFQQQQDKLVRQQEQDRARLQQKQDQQHAQMQKKNADEARQHQLESQHQQQTRQLAEKQQKQSQQLQKKQTPPPPPHHSDTQPH